MPDDINLELVRRVIAGHATKSACQRWFVHLRAAPTRPRYSQEAATQRLPRFAPELAMARP